MYYDMKGLMDSYDSLYGDMFGYGASPTQAEICGVDMSDIYQAAAIGVSVNSEGIKIDYAMTFDAESLPEELRGSGGRAQAPKDVLEQIPADALGFVAAAFPGTSEEDLQARFDACPDLEEQIEDMEDEFGINLIDLLTWMSGDMAIAVIEGGSDELAIPISAFALIGSQDMEAAQDAIEELVELAEDEGADLGDEEIEGVEMQVLEEGGEIIFGYGFTEAYVVLGFLEDGLEAAVASDVESIADDDTFRHVQANLPRDSSVYVYLDIEGIWQLVYDNMSEWEQDDFDDNTRPYLEPIKAIGMGGGGSYDDEYIVFSTFIYIP